MQNRDLEFLFEIGSIRNIQRFWKRFFNSNVANDAEHIFRVTWIAWMIAAKEKVGNKEKILKMALLHDIVESRTGDLDYLSHAYSERNEDKAIRDMAKGTEFESELTALWDEYKKRESIEAKIVKDADVLDVDLELAEQEAQGQKLKSLWFEKRKKFVYTKLYTNSAKKLWEEIYIADPHDWHVKGDNIYNK